MSRRYDSRTTTFNPEGRLLQVEYAMEAINNAGATVAVISQDGIAFAAERNTSTKLLETVKQSEKFYTIDDHLAVGIAGLTSDANVLLDYSRDVCQNYTLAYGVPMPVEQLVHRLCDYKQWYTQHGSLRPFGVAVLYASYEDKLGYQLFNSDPSGNYSAWKACAIGAQKTQSMDILKADYKEDMSIQEAIKLVTKVICKTMDTTSPAPERVEVMTLARVNGKMRFDTLPNEAVGEVIAEVAAETS